MDVTRRALLASLLIALTVAAGFALAGVPNIELVTLIVFVSGYLLGARLGALVGGVAMGAHSAFNIMGTAIPPILLAQVACYAVVGWAGGTLGPMIERTPARPAAALSALTGAVLVVAYQVLVNVVSFYTFSRGEMFWPYLWGGIAFASVHIAWNAVLFLVAMRPMLAVLRVHRMELQGG